MIVETLVHPHTIERDNLPEAVAAIGFFDGVHKGHQAVIAQAIDKAKESGKESVVVTFDPHPSVVLQKNNNPVKYITPINAKVRRLEELGVDRVYVVHFDKELAKLSPQEFIEQFIIGLHITHLVAGFDFTFGHKGAGNMKNIHEMIDNHLEVTTVTRLDYQDEKVSSTRIREQMKQGNMEEIETLLGRPYSLMGEVIHGDKRGRTIGFPTANVKVEEDYIIPKIGVYAVEIEIGNKKYFGMANIGYNPTFTDDRENKKIEVHIFDFNDDIYGETIVVDWKKYIRTEEKFSGVDELIKKMREDEVISRDFFRINK
ncbi:bifunctional riboflavin kinase/FAD synthetase [Gracilibacillus sp. S3-1-1]|uniref:Bifunctional riboflavin kinase/FAD synthetase n=1 Tax=Gracilibacillus pellucidus TaxID=3095368 RepID=A0ACC6M7Q0_9BACI|nr:bifunctional riboflavin kinase/FAD synthetase [Gracilibacillus sp. S3-1-1]MDX8046984.1 bifunctional riboflavin kinase/FAD synthetase [Gracilibacillus sp. S3-1-1]